MTPAEQNGRMKLSWGQITFSIGLLVAVLAAWGDLRVSIARIETKLEGNVARIAALEARNAAVGFSRMDAERMREDILNEVDPPRRPGVREANAAERPRPRR